VSPLIQVRAFAVHVFTATGAALALTALFYAVEGQWTSMFLCLGIALIIDAVDGTIARYVGVAGVLPRWSGDLLDLVVDFATYVFVPAYAIAAGGILPAPLALPAGALIVITGAIYFADRQMKLPGNYFRGFPALWNGLAFYLFLIRPAPWFALLIVIAFSVLTFMPFKFLHPIRVKRFRALNVTAVLIGSMLAIGALIYELHPAMWVTAGLLLIGLYFLVVGSTDRERPAP
jgi:phosphatidylcholine synthase